MDRCVCKKELEGGSGKIGEWYEAESLSPVLQSVHLVKCNPAVQPFSKELAWSHHRFYGNWFYVESRVEIEMDIDDCGDLVRKEEKVMYMLLERNCESDCVYQAYGDVLQKMNYSASPPLLELDIPWPKLLS